MTCPISISNSTHVLNIAFWMCFTLSIHALGTYFFWNKRWYAYLRSETFIPAEKVTTTALICMAVANSYAAWRVWFCNNWDTTNGVIILSLYFFMIVAEAVFIPAIMLSTSGILAIVIALIGTGLSIAYTVCTFVIIEDTWSGLVGVADSFLCAVLLLLAVNVQYRAQTIYTEYDSIKDNIKRKYGSVKSSDLSTSQTQSSQQNTNPANETPTTNSAIGSSMTHRHNATKSHKFDSDDFVIHS